LRALRGWLDSKLFMQAGLMEQDSAEHQLKTTTEILLTNDYFLIDIIR
jgi:hypothetical protein